MSKRQLTEQVNTVLQQNSNKRGIIVARPKGTTLESAMKHMELAKSVFPAISKDISDCMPISVKDKEFSCAVYVFGENQYFPNPVENQAEQSKQQQEENKYKNRYQKYFIGYCQEDYVFEFVEY